MKEVIGYIVGETTTTEVSFISNKVPEVGSYVSIEYPNGKEVLGMVEGVVQNCPIFKEVLNVEDILKLRTLEKDDSYQVIGKIKILGDVEEKEIPKIPPKPGTEVYSASDEVLKRMFSQGHIEIGKLLSKDVPVKLNANMLCSRHLAILAITGMGKSNTVAVLLSELNKLNATVLVFDIHGEYRHIESYDPDNRLRVNILEPKINVYNISSDSLADLAGVDVAATKQRPYIRKAIDKVKKGDNGEKKIRRESDFSSVEEYIGDIINTLDNLSEEYSRDYNSIQTAKFRLEDMLKFKRHLITLHYNPVEKIRENHINIIPLEGLDENDMDVFISYMAREILADRKRALREGYPKPIFIVLEEAHLIIPKNRTTRSKLYISRIAREGRKFGVGLCLVSQRPKTLDPEALSQCNNLIISKLIEPHDQQHVQQASESLSEDLLKQLPGLNVGEAIIIGPALNIPALVKINKFNGRYGGEDLDIVEIWKKSHREKIRGEEPLGDYEGLD
ncbi:MAG TPA: ATP-binding protein [Methanothermococcus okinawensis]|uniref:ATP-binding protein n=1 Tax=Methanothermococcus okinawensis TaxID=155863 RepID=A0A832ZE43_9EURY|nr:ATP-binding protein [Methanothermococcus okinawensis]HIP91135.1 ATP-binding protein [Methanothermococcus okinawensis]